MVQQRFMWGIEGLSGDGKFNVDLFTVPSVA